MSNQMYGQRCVLVGLLLFMLAFPLTLGKVLGACGHSIILDVGPTFSHNAITHIILKFLGLLWSNVLKSTYIINVVA